MKSITQLVLVFLTVVFLVAPRVLGFLDIEIPSAGLEYDADAAFAEHGSNLTFTRTGPDHLRDITPFNSTYWCAKTVTSLSTIKAWAHIGNSGDSQGAANGKIDDIQIWAWKDKDGDGAADEDDAKGRGGTTKWIKVYEIDPNGDDAVADGNVVGWEVSTTQTSSAYHTNLLQNGSTITVGPGQYWIFILRVIDTSGNTNLFTTAGGVEQWDNGDTSDGIGSDVPRDKYVTIDGDTPGTDDNRINDLMVVNQYSEVR